MVRERRAPRIHPGCTLVCKCDASLCLEAEEVDYITLIVLRTGYSVYVFDLADLAGLARGTSQFHEERKV